MRIQRCFDQSSRGCGQVIGWVGVEGHYYIANLSCVSMKEIVVGRVVCAALMWADDRTYLRGQENHKHGTGGGHSQGLVTQHVRQSVLDGKIVELRSCDAAEVFLLRCGRQQFDVVGLQL